MRRIAGKLPFLALWEVHYWAYKDSDWSPNRGTIQVSLLNRDVRGLASRPIGSGFGYGAAPQRAYNPRIIKLCN